MVRDDDIVTVDEGSAEELYEVYVGEAFKPYDYYDYEDYIEGDTQEAEYLDYEPVDPYDYCIPEEEKEVTSEEEIHEIYIDDAFEPYDYEELEEMYDRETLEYLEALSLYQMEVMLELEQINKCEKSETVEDIPEEVIEIPIEILDDNCDICVQEQEKHCLSEQQEENEKDWTFSVPTVSENKSERKPK